MGDRDIGDDGEQLTPAEAFKIVGNETRLTILRELFAAHDRPMSFTELRKRVGLRDGSQFNYHLEKLEGPFVRKADEGYYLRHAGTNVIRAIASGSLTDHPRIDPFDIDGTCVRCGDGLQARYEDEMVFIECPACDQLHVMGKFPPGGLVGRTNEEVLLAHDQQLRWCYALALAGVCFMCSGRVTKTVLGESAYLPDETQYVQTKDDIDYPHGPGAVYRCERCDAFAYLTAGEHLLFDPDVIGFHRDHGVDLNRVPLWKLDWTIPAANDQYVSILSEDPLQFQVRISLADEVLRATLDEKMAVVEVERESAIAPESGDEAG